MNIFKRIKAWRAVRRVKKSVKNSPLENAGYWLATAKQAALNHPDREYGEHLMKKLGEYDFNRQNEARSVGFGYKRGSNHP